MSRWEFMRKLEELLSDISPSEREEALKYYNEYINDGGNENEAEVLKSLGTPEEVAAIVKEGLLENAGEFTETGFKSKAFENSNSVANYQAQESQGQNSNQAKEAKGMSGGMIALIVVLCVLFSPVIIGLCGAFLGLFISIIAGLFGFLLAFGISSIVFLIVGIALVFVGLFRIFFGPLSGLAMIAVGLVLGGIGLLFLLLTAFIIVKVLPAVFKGTGYLFEKLFNGKRG
ncbi:MAG: hypothetical protein FWG91_04035 [Lachnospiraceae bacterium]|nr:hypothetical protein [Lachnospiraceae bacterium]